MLDGYKTFTIAILMLVGTVVLIVTGKMPVDSWWQIVASVAGMIGIREFADKFKPSGAGDRLTDK